MFINYTGTVGIIIKEMVNNLTGSIFLALLTIMLFLFIICMVLRIDIELSMILMLPIIIVSMAYTKEFVTIGGVALIYAGILLAKYWIINR